MPSRAVKLFAILVACLGLAFGLAACGGDDDSSATVALTDKPGAPQAGESPGGATARDTPAPAETEPPPAEEEPAEEPAAEEETGGAGGGANAEGKAIFTQSCAGCHTLADAGASGSVGPNLDEAKLPADAVAAMVRSGGGGMPSFGGQLDPAQIDQVAAYVAAAAG